MPCEVLIRATDAPAGPIKKGHIIVVRGSGHAWQAKEQPPDWIQIAVTDADVDDLIPFTKDWPLRFRHTVEDDRVSQRRMRIEVAPGSISSGTSTGRDEIRAEMFDHVQRVWGATQVSRDPDALVVNVPKPFDVNAFEGDFADKFDQPLETKRYILSSAEVDAILAAPGGRARRTLAQVQAALRDRLAE